MATLQTLPTELLLLICRFFDDFDDALRLRRTCSRLGAILAVPENRHQVLETILEKIDTAGVWDSNIADGLAVLAREVLSSNQAIPQTVCWWHSIKIFKMYGLGMSSDFEYPWGVKVLVGQTEGYEEAISWAAMKGHRPVVKMLLYKGADVDSADDDGERPLTCAAAAGDERMIQLLLDNDANIALEDTRHGRAPLLWAAEKGHCGAAKLLLDQGADIESKDTDGLTALGMAAMRGHEAIVELLLQNGAEVDCPNSEGRTPLLLAAQRLRQNAFSVLLDWCSQPGRQHILSLADREGLAPLHCVCTTHWSITFIKRLVAEGADMCALDSSGNSPLSLALQKLFPSGKLTCDDIFERVEVLSQHRQLIRTPGKNRRLPIHFAAGWSDPRIILYLLDNGGQPALNHLDQSGDNALCIAMQHKNEDVVETLLRMPDLELRCQNSAGSVEIHTAVEFCTPNIVSAILQYKPALLNAVDAQGRTPLLAAIGFNRRENFECLLKEGADPSITDKRGEDALRCALEDEGGLPFYELLVDRDYIKVDHNGNTLLHRAVLGSEVQRVHDLLASPATDLHAQNLAGEIALHTAAQNAQADMLQGMIAVLLESDPRCHLARATDHSGKAALDYALERGSEDSIKLLVQPKWNAAVGLEWSSESEWTTKWAGSSWYPDLIRIIQSPDPHTKASARLLEQTWGPPLRVFEQKNVSVTHENTSEPYISVQIPGAAAPFPIRRIIFTVVSHDQGTFIP
ncbi:ankyrin [Aspergillus ellipticus CBS 707.79]|uniref:Ankyrin n=1 Tax=Aspergillus ellipticus CBS 707.79 TaxID=1448320 RepID=A0A319DGC2_9EURO|nr:ankyrin [Aspergillus ellipticus CBS 707.79]